MAGCPEKTAAGIFPTAEGLLEMLDESKSSHP